jgi:quercetin dioxygenase-like cupin family protein
VSRRVPEFHSEALSVIRIDALAPDGGPELHRHPYEEVFVILEGEATFTLGDETRVARAGDFVVAAPGVTHGFKNTGAGPLRSVNIHASPAFDTEWL